MLSFSIKHQELNAILTALKKVKRRVQ